jgi:hypothetical protein
MCPVCFSSVAWLFTGGVSVVGATAGGVASANPSESRHFCHSLAARYLHQYLYMTTMHSVISRTQRKANIRRRRKRQ